MSGGIVEGALLSAALSGAGMLLQNNAADDAANKRQSILNAAADETSKKSAQKNDILTNFTDQTYNTGNRLKTYDDAATKTESGLLDALTKNSDGEVNSDVAGKISDDYTRGRAAATSAAATDIANRAKLMARNGARSNMFNQEALKGGQLSSDVAGINSDINRTNNYANTQVNAVRDKGSLLGGLLSGAAGGIGSSYGKAAGNWASAMKAMGG